MKMINNSIINCSGWVLCLLVKIGNLWPISFDQLIYSKYIFLLAM